MSASQPATRSNTTPSTPYSTPHPILYPSPLRGHSTSSVVSCRHSWFCLQGISTPPIQIPELGIQISAQPLGVSYSGSNNIRSDNQAIGMDSNLWVCACPGLHCTALPALPACTARTAA